MLGAGGMGEVYRARDPQLQREVAVKVLPPAMASDAARLKRFEREARSASALNHPNIVTIHEVGQTDSTFFIVMELVEGRSLRDLLSAGPLPLRKVLSIAAQVADGLAKAHASGIVHRDLKPENVMVTSEGFVKILDFGLAKLTHPGSERGEEEQDATIPGDTDPGVVMGTVFYMSPEQAVGQPLDFRSDQFSFGSILYEMATGKRAFERTTKPETLAAIIREEPEPIAALNPRAPSHLRWIVERCLAKEPQHRYAATEDLARDLSTLREHVSDLSGEARLDEAPRRRPRWGAIGLAAALLLTLAGIYLLGQRVGRSHISPPRFRQVTFGSAGISTARFAPDGQSIVYAAQWEGKPSELFTARVDSPGARSLGLSRAEILSISSSGQMALLLAPPFGPIFLSPHSDIIGREGGVLVGTLAEAPLAGGAPRELLEGVAAADWSPDGKSLATMRYGEGVKGRLEFPPGKVLFEANFIRATRVSISPTGDRVAFQLRGVLHVTEPGGGVRNLGERPLEFVWSRATNEIWFNSVAGGATDLFAVLPGRPKRRVTTLPGDFALHDISPDGRVLLGRISESSEILGDFPGEARPRNLSHLDRSVVVALAPSGDTLLFNDMGQSGRRAFYLRRTDASPPKRLADGYGWALSPDGKFVLSSNPPGPEAFLVPTGPGQSRPIEIPRGLQRGGEMGFFPDSRRIWFLAAERGQGRRAWVQDLSGGKPRAISPPGITLPVLAGDGRFLCAKAADGDWYLYSTGTAESRKVAGLLPGESPTQWTADGKHLYVRSADEPRPGEPAITRVHRLDPWTGRRELWKELRPINPLTGGTIGRILFSADGKTCLYTHHRFSSELFLVEGLK
ncbi:MAG: protein kinase [Acidobacteriota bacterium]|nr:protein kinase [Acidobacteriota bacterium]